MRDTGKKRTPLRPHSTGFSGILLSDVKLISPKRQNVKNNTLSSYGETFYDPIVPKDNM